MSLDNISQDHRLVAGHCRLGIVHINRPRKAGQSATKCEHGGDTGVWVALPMDLLMSSVDLASGRWNGRGGVGQGCQGAVLLGSCRENWERAEAVSFLN